MDPHPIAPSSHAPLPERILYEVKKVVVGQDAFLERVLVAILAQGHLLVEGVPGLAKTLTVKTLARTIRGTFKRIQFTPDLVPADLVGTRIYNQKSGEFSTSLGPVFTNLLLADEINRAPAKVQSALLEVMQERQVTIGRETHKVPDPFLVLAGIPDQDLHHEAVDLCFRQRIGTFGLDRILRCHDQERLGNTVGRSGNRDLVFLHHLKQRALHLCRRAIDFISEQQVREHGTERRVELAGLLVVDTGAHEVRGNQVRRELDALERALNRARQRLDGERLGQARHAFDEEMALGQHGHHDAFEKMILPDDDAFHFVEDPLHQRRYVADGAAAG